MSNGTVLHSNAGPRATLLRWAGWFSVANALVLMLISLRYLKLMPFPDAALGLTFLGLSFPGHFLALAFYLFPLAALGILCYPRRGFAFALLGTLQLCLVLGVIIDTLVFAQYRFHLNGMVLNLLTGGAAGDVLPMTGKLWLLLALALLLLGALEWFLAVSCWRLVQKRRGRLGSGVALLVFLIILSSHVMHAWADANNVTSVTSQVRYLPAFKPLTAKRLMAKLGLGGGQQGVKLKAADRHSGLSYPLEKLTFREDGQKPLNLLFIVIDSWRFDNLNPESTPNIWNFAQKGWRFENHYSSGNATRFGIFGLFYGLYGTYWHAVLAEERSPVLMQELERRAYRMGIFASAPLVSPEFDRTVFADLRGSITLRTAGAGVAQKDQAITDKMLQFLDENPQGSPFFGFLFYDAPHTQAHPPGFAPFQPALQEVDYLKLDNDYDPRPFYNKYRNSVRYVDDLVGRVLAQLERKKLLDNTVVVITGDHGEEFNDLKLNYWGHGGNFSRFQSQTPLAIRWPGQAPRHFSQVTSHLDLAPTLMRELLGCQTDPAKYSNGRSLMDTGARPFTLISSWDSFSISEPDRITVSHPTGEVEILDRSYRPLKGAQPRPRLTVEAMEGMGRFFAR